MHLPDLAGLRPVGIPLQATPEDVARGRAYRARQDATHTNVFEPPEDRRWCGDVAEYPVGRWFHENACAPLFVRHLGGDGLPDFRFLINHATADLKTRPRYVRPVAHFSVLVSDSCHGTPRSMRRHPDAPVPTAFCFASYELPTDVVWFLGGIDRVEFFDLARFVPRGGWFGGLYNGRPYRATSDCWELPIEDDRGQPNLTPPRAWLRDLELKELRHA